MKTIPTAVLTMPEELRVFTLTQAKNASPYNRFESGSFYDCTDKSWGYTPDGSIRVSDHWNFYSRGEVHCKTDVSNDRLAGKWTVAKYNASTGFYHVISIDDKDRTALDKRIKRENYKNENIVINSPKEKRIARANQIRREKEAAIRAKKIKNGLKDLKGTKIWVEVEVNKWIGSGRKVRFDGVETLIGYLIWESKTGNSFCIRMETGNAREIRKYNSYKELKRKPIN